MRELKLKYVIDLVSNLGPKAQADAKSMEQAQAVMAAAITGTNNKWLDYSKLTLLAGKNTSTMQEVITGATNKFAAMDRAMTQLGNNTSLERQAAYLQRIGRAAEYAQGKAQAMRDALAHGLDKAPEAFARVTAGAYGAQAIVAPPVRAFSSLEAATTELKTAMLTAKGRVDENFAKISAEAVQLGNQLPGSTKDFMLAARALQTQGVPSEVVANGGLRASSYVGALLGVPQEQAAEIIAKLREAHGLKDTELVPMADLVQKAFFGFGIKPQDYLETAKYAAATFNTMGISGFEKTRQTLAIQGMAASVGLEASSFGTNYSALLTRLSQVDPRLAKKSKEAREIKAMLGEHGIQMSFYDDKGVFKGNLNMLQELAKLRALNPLEQTRVIHTLFGTEAGRPAQILVQKGLEGYEQALATLDKQADLDQRITMKMDTFAAKLESLSGTIENVQAAMAKQVGEMLKPAMDKANETLGGPVQGFFERNPSAGTTALTGATVISAWLGQRFGGGLVTSLLARAGLSAGAAAAGGAAAASLAGATGVGAAGLFAGSQLLRLGSALLDLRNIQTREGVTLAPEARDRVMAAALRAPNRALGFSSVVPDIAALRAPGGALGDLALPGGTLQLGEGKLAVEVRVSDDRTTARATVERQMPVVRIDAGNTNPAGYRR